MQGITLTTASIHVLYTCLDIGPLGIGLFINCFMSIRFILQIPSIIYNSLHYLTCIRCELFYMCTGHDLKLHPHRVKLYRLGCVGSDLVLAKVLT